MSSTTLSIMATTEPILEALQTIVDPWSVNDGCLRPAKTSVNESDFQPWNNPHNIISQKTEWWISTVCNFGLIPFLFLIGAIGNVLSATVFYKQGLRVRVNLCLFCLAIADQVAVTTYFLVHFEGTYRAFGGNLNVFISYILGLMGFSVVSYFLSAVIACERCFCVVSPLKAQQMFSTRQMAVFIFVISAILLGGFLTVVGHKHIMKCLTDPASNKSSLIIYTSDWFRAHEKPFNITDVFIYSTFLPIFFVTIVTVTTVVTAVKLRTAIKWRNKTVYAMSENGKDTGDAKRQQQAKPVSNMMKEAAVTKMLVATSVLFIICILPTIMVQLATFCEPELRSGGLYHNLSTALWTLVSLFKCLNSALNFPVYCLMGSKFRKMLKAVVTCSKGGKVGRSESSVQTAANYTGSLKP